MKKLFLLFALFSLTSCGAQQFENVEPLPPKIVKSDFTVMQTTEETATLFSDQTSVIYEVDNIGLEKEREYLFILQIAEGDAPVRIRQATVLYFGISEDQARKDNNDAVFLFNKLNGPPKK